MSEEKSAQTAAVLQRHIQAVKSGDPDRVLRNFTDESVIFTPDGLVRGREAIRRDTETFFATTPSQMLRAIEILRQDVEGEVAYLLWKAEPFVTLAAETFIIRKGKILVQTFAFLGGPALAA